ncbi:MAG: hypothetical protein Q9170_000966 [Blastenia crenularia]
MRFHYSYLSLSTSFILLQLSLCAPPITHPALTAAPIHVPVCRADPGGFDLFICARLLSALKNLPYYTVQEVWAEYARGDGHLPAIFSYQDQSGQRSCYLSMDLYEPGIPKTAKERFSLEKVQTDLNNIYFECLKAKGKGGFNRIGLFGNVAALLGPALDANNPLLGHFQGLKANVNGSSEVHTIDLTPYGKPDASA